MIVAHTPQAGTALVWAIEGVIFVQWTWHFSGVHHRFSAWQWMDAEGYFDLARGIIQNNPEIETFLGTI